MDIALPYATQNELDVGAAHQSTTDGVRTVAKGASTPIIIAVTDLFLEANMLFAPGRAANVSGVATPGPEMAQNAARMGRKVEKVDARLHHIMLGIHHAYAQYDGKVKQINYVRGVSITGFMKVADTMSIQGAI